MLSQRNTKLICTPVVLLAVCVPMYIYYADNLTVVTTDAIVPHWAAPVKNGIGPEPSSSSAPSTTGGPELSSSSTPSTTGGSEPSSSSAPSTTGGPEPSSSSTPSTSGGPEPSLSSAPSTNISDGIPSPIRACTQRERINHMQKYCEGYPELTTRTMMEPAWRSIIDYKHRLTFCWMSKAGCTSIKAFIMEANGMKINEKSETDSLNKVHFNEQINKFGVKQMRQLNKTDQHQIVDEFFNFFAIRHPFARLVAYYRDKLVDDDRSSDHPKRKRDILKFARPNVFKNNATLNEMELPQFAIGNPNFDEFMMYAYDQKLHDDHWAIITKTCHPCAHNWSAILRIETMDIDGDILKDRLNTTAESVPVRHSHEGPRNYSTFEKPLPYYANVSGHIIDYWLNYFSLDMAMFGYGWDRNTNTAYCALKTEDGYCC